MRANADVNFEISGQDMGLLKNLDQIKDYGEASMFRIYSR